MLSDSQEPSLGTACTLCSVSCLSAASPRCVPLTVCGAGRDGPAAGVAVSLQPSSDCLFPAQRLWLSAVSLSL